MLLPAELAQKGEERGAGGAGGGGGGGGGSGENGGEGGAAGGGHTYQTWISFAALKEQEPQTAYAE